MTSRTARETNSDAIEYDTVERLLKASSSRSHIDDIVPEIVLIARLEVIYTQNGQKLAKFGDLTLKYFGWYIHGLKTF